jgi:hypothetical protein
MIHETSGPTPSASFAEYDPDSRFWKTFQGSLLTGTTVAYSETWPRAGSMRNGQLSLREPSEPARDEPASGSWPTPDTQNDRDGSVMRTAAKGAHAVSLHHKAAVWPTPATNSSTYSNGFMGPNLREKAATWPTPTAGDGKSARNRTASRQLDSKHHDGETLTDKVVMWRTPQAQEPGINLDRLDGAFGHRMYDKETGRLAQYSLTQQAKAWPTPRANKWGFPDSHGRIPDTTSLQAPTTQTDGHECSPKCRRLNPLFVAWLMGFPIGWLGSEPSGTP